MARDGKGKGLIGDIRRVGIIVAGDPPVRFIEPIVGHDVEPVALKFRWTHGQGSDFEIPVRDLTAEEIVQLVNRALSERRLVFGFQVPDSPAIVPPGGM